MPREDYDNLSLPKPIKAKIMLIVEYLQQKNNEHTGVGKVRPFDVINMLCDEYMAKEMQ